MRLCLKGECPAQDCLGNSEKNAADTLAGLTAATFFAGSHKQESPDRKLGGREEIKLEKENGTKSVRRTRF